MGNYRDEEFKSKTPRGQTMNGNFLKRIPVTFVALAASVSVFAGSDTDTRLQQLEQQMKQVRTETAAGTYGARTAIARPEVDGSGVFLSLDALLWKSNVGGSEYAYTDATPLAGFPQNGSVKQADFDWSWGVRAGVGYNFDHDGWDTYLNFTYFQSKNSSDVSVNSNASIIPLKGAADLTYGSLGAELFSCLEADTDYKFTYYNLDLDLGRNYFVSKDLSFRPHFGLKNSWIDLKQNTQYTGGPTLGVNYFKQEDTSKLWGIGPSTGVNSKWYLGNGFSIFGDAAGSLLWGYFKVNHEEVVSNDPTTSNIDITANEHRFVPTAQLVLGLSYDRYFNNDKCHIGLTLGWESIYYWRANQMLNIEDFATKKYSRISEDASMTGVTLHLRCDF